MCTCCLSYVMTIHLSRATLVGITDIRYQCTLAVAVNYRSYKSEKKRLWVLFDVSFLIIEVFRIMDRINHCCMFATWHSMCVKTTVKRQDQNAPGYFSNFLLVNAFHDEWISIFNWHSRQAHPIKAQQSTTVDFGPLKCVFIHIWKIMTIFSWNQTLFAVESQTSAILFTFFYLAWYHFRGLIP